MGLCQWHFRNELANFSFGIHYRANPAVALLIFDRIDEERKK